MTNISRICQIIRKQPGITKRALRLEFSKYIDVGKAYRYYMRLKKGKKQPSNPVRSGRLILAGIYICHYIKNGRLSVDADDKVYIIEKGEGDDKTI